MRKICFACVASILFAIGCGPTQEQVQEAQEKTEEAVQETNDLIEQMAEEQSEAEDSTTVGESDSLSKEDVEGAE